MTRRKKPNPKDDKYFHYYNNNPKDRHVGDCSYRALALFLGITWEEAARIAWKCYLETGTMAEYSNINRSSERDYPYTVGKMNIEYYLEEKYGCIKIPPVEYSRYNEKFKVYVPGDLAYFIDNYAEADEVYFVSGTRHFTVVKNKKVWDTSNCKGMWPTAIYAKAK